MAVCNKWTQLRQISQPQISDRQAVIEQNLVVALRHGARKYIATKEEITHLEVAKGSRHPWLYLYLFNRLSF